jgi:L-cysteine S-thiosulfotransferase
LRFLLWLLLLSPAFADEAKPFEGLVGDFKRGELLFNNHRASLCLLCHKDGGGIAPSLKNVGVRLTPSQLRFRIIDQRRINPQTIMPPFYVKDGMMNVADKFKNETILNPQQIEDLVAYVMKY